MKTTIPVSILAKQNGELRTLLREVLAIDPEEPGGEALRAIHTRIHDALSDQTGRSRQGFAHPNTRAAIIATVNAKIAPFYEAHGQTLRTLRDEGLSFAAMAVRLNQMGIPAPAGGIWAKGSVKHVFDRLPPE